MFSWLIQRAEMVVRAQDIDFGLLVTGLLLLYHALSLPLPEEGCTRLGWLAAQPPGSVLHATHASTNVLPERTQPVRRQTHDLHPQRCRSLPQQRGDNESQETQRRTQNLS